MVVLSQFDTGINQAESDIQEQYWELDHRIYWRSYLLRDIVQFDNKRGLVTINCCIARTEV